MRVLVTGASGFIGSTLVPALAAAGHQVVKAPRESAGIAAAIDGCEAVVHLANLAHAVTDRARLWAVNVEGTRALAQLAARRGVRRFLYLSSIKASGEETAGAPFDGTEAPAPGDDYGRAKLAAEQALLEAVPDARILRPPLVYGPGVKGNFLALMRAIARGWPLPLGGIANRRSLLYVENLAHAIERCLTAAARARRIHVLSDDAPVSTTELCEALGAALGVRARLFSFPAPLLELVPAARRLTRSLEVDNRLFRDATGWHPVISAHEGLQRTARWYRAG